MATASPNAPSPGSIYPPPPKRQRVSPNPQSPPYGSPNSSNLQLPSAGSPINGFSVLAASNAPAPAGSMGPPSRPADRDIDKNDFDDAVKDAGVDLEVEQANLAGNFQMHRPSFTSLDTQHVPNHAGANSFGSPNGINGINGFSEHNTPLYGGENSEAFAEAQQNWKAGSRHQYHLTNPFLIGEMLERRMHAKAADQNLNTPKEGLYHATAGRPPQRTQVIAPDKSTEVIDKGQTILSQEGKVLTNLMSLISLACKERLTGFVDHASRLAHERRNFSMGRVPAEWRDLAIADGLAQSDSGRANSPQKLPMKRTLNFGIVTFIQINTDLIQGTHSQANDVGNGGPSLVATNRMAGLFRTVSKADRLAEEARLAKRTKRKNTSGGADTGSIASVSTPGPSTPVATPSEPEKRPTKKAQKLADAKFTEQQQHKSANETVRMATSGLGGMFGKKKNYAWLNAGKKTTPSATPNASSINLSLEDDVAPRTVPAVAKPPVVRSVKQFGEWDEETDQRARGICIRDVILVLEADGRAMKALSTAYNQPEEGD
ncbi:MAG: hypothetical protein Q9227_003968 [Pyrenula ochraceoflavens]